jgi:hypothetical protein
VWPRVSTMLSSINALWPPSGPKTGTKTLRPARQLHATENLGDLHEPAWWSGVRIYAATPSQTLRGLHAQVRLIKADRTPAIDLASCEWTQEISVWTKFPWAIPAAMAKELGLTLEARLIPTEETEGLNEPIYIGITTCFHELPLMKPHDCYLFVDSDGRVLHQWNGLQQTDGTPYRGAPPVWRTSHRVVQPLSILKNDVTVCIHDWNHVS